MAHLISGKYEVLSQIGKGGMGVVYQVRHRTLETLLALKVLPAELAEDVDLVRRFHQEARVMAQLRHPHIVHVQDVDRDGDTHFFVMEYIEGQSLSQYLRERGPLPLLEVLAITKQIAQALDYAHTHQPPVIHRDIKPANILLGEGAKQVVVTDFGIAKVLGATERTRTGLVMGTLRYCAPEQILQNRELDGRADIYSLGLMIYEMATGRPFFVETDERALLGRILQGPGENVPTFTGPVAPEFVALVTRAIARDRERRYPWAAELLRDIETCLAPDSPTAPTVPLGETAASDQRKTQQEEKRRWLWRPYLWLRISVVLSVALAAIFVFTYWLPHPKIPPPSSPPSFVLREYERAFEKLKVGQMDAALSTFQWLAAYPENPFGLGYDGLAAIYFEKGLVAEAKEAIQKSLAANPANTMALLVQGDISFAMGEGEKAVNEYLQATKAETQWGWQKALAYNALGVSYSLEGMTAKARSCFNEALSSDRGSFAAYSNLGYLLWQEGNMQAAQRSFEKARELQRDDELSQTLLEMISTKGSEDPTKSAGEKILLVPFALGGGNLRRLGEREA